MLTIQKIPISNSNTPNENKTKLFNMKFTSFILLALSPTAMAFSPMGGKKSTTMKTQAVSVTSDEPQKEIFDPMGLYPEDSLERQSGVIRSLEPPSMEKDLTVIDPLSIYQDKSELTQNVVMSASLPFLKRPELLDGSLPGDRGFDPLNFSSSESALSWYRNSEIKHARLAMLAAVGWPLAELSHKSLASQLDLDPVLALQDKAPSVLNGGLGLTDPLFWVGAISAAAALEFIDTKNNNNNVDDPSSFAEEQPGDFGFDPLSLSSGNNESRSFFLREAEIFNGRLAMMAITGFVAQEFYTNTAVINETPIFFKPFGDVVAQLLDAGAASV
mmetsp:Transcript_13613/g.28778  ORF Transcript_13613/g.28778 Transcript_13613/m.28778 type:complete len:330 (-) Transcript_13613:2468-3457(-)